MKSTRGDGRSKKKELDYLAPHHATLFHPMQQEKLWKLSSTTVNPTGLEGVHIQRYQCSKHMGRLRALDLMLCDATLPAHTHPTVPRVTVERSTMTLEFLNFLWKMVWGPHATVLDIRRTIIFLWQAEAESKYVGGKTVKLFGHGSRTV